MKQTLYVPIGIPACGKTYYYHNNMNPEEVLRISRDDINAFLSNSVYNKKISKVIRRIEISSLEAAISDGFSVYIDRTNLTPKERAKFLDTARYIYSEIKVVGIIFKVNKELSILRNRDRDQSIDMRDGIEKFINTAIEIIQEPQEYEKFDEVIYVS